jgi:hypothetical protein
MYLRDCAEDGEETTRCCGCGRIGGCGDNGDSGSAPASTDDDDSGVDSVYGFDGGGDGEEEGDGDEEVGGGGDLISDISSRRNESVATFFWATVRPCDEGSIRSLTLAGTGLVGSGVATAEARATTGE